MDGLQELEGFDERLHKKTSLTTLLKGRLERHEIVLKIYGLSTWITPGTEEHRKSPHRSSFFGFLNQV